MVGPDELAVLQGSGTIIRLTTQSSPQGSCTVVGITWLQVRNVKTYFLKLYKQLVY